MTQLEANAREIPEEDVLRSQYYALLAQVFHRPPDGVTLARLAALEGNHTPLGGALARLAQVSAIITPQQAEDEFSALFVGLTQGELQPYASYYLTGFLYEKPLAALREDMAALGVVRAPGSSEPEDHIASVCEVMQGIITGSFGIPVRLSQQKAFFNAHVASWASTFFEDLEQARSARLYRPVGTVGRMFMAIEREAFSMVD